LLPFTIDVAESILIDLRKRLEHTRWSSEIAAGWDAGMDAAYLRELVDYWRQGYNWRDQERKLNRFAHYRADIEGIGIHFIHERGKGPAPFPLVLKLQKTKRIGKTDKHKRKSI